MARLPTVTVHDANPRGWKIINEADFDPRVHTAYGSPADRDAMEARAKALGIKGVHLMKDETLAARIAEADG